MLVMPNQLFATLALFLLFSFTELSQGRKRQPRNDMEANVECGRRPAAPRIVGGTDAVPGSWPWQVLLDFKGFPGPQWCGGSILNEYWIVTAAHCFGPGTIPSNYTVTVGEHDVRVVEGNEQVIPIDRIILHPNWNRPTADYDIALIKLKNPIKFNSNVRPVCLPTTDFATGTDCYISGWGRTVEGGSAAEILQQAQVPLVSRDTCQKAYDDLVGVTITERMRCAGPAAGKIGPCQADSGGPLVCPKNNKWYLMGITSWGVGCARENRYGVYADVLELKSWVQETIN
ncbi:trypsin-like isoform X2 [Oculina patagonica]